ncbi:MAG: protein kinase, partial [Pirellulaceae bacterium]
MTQSKPQTCLSDADLHRFLKEQIAEQEEASLQEHIGQCSDCRAKMETIAAGQAMWDALRDGAIGRSGPTIGDQTKDANAETAADDPNLAGLLDYLGPTEDPQYLGRLGSYEVCGVIGQGSTGIVLKALETRLNRFVAIKVLTPALASSGPARRRFEREGRAIAAVSHEHVVPIYSVDEHRGLPYIVMQYIPGLSLLQRIEKSGSLDTCEVTRIGYQVASALAAAHGQGIIHRDVKPANVLLHGSVDRAMVTDFGLARVSDDATMTRSGTISGTPQYMSPEQARGEVADARTDLFSLGSLMYAASTARAPFRAETVFGIIHRVCQTNPHPIRELNPDIAPWLCKFIDKLMAKQPEARFESA